jgi:hypothetical protein
MKNTAKFSEEMLYILSTLKFAGSLLAFYGGNVHFRLIPPKVFSLVKWLMDKLLLTMHLLQVFTFNQKYCNFILHLETFTTLA